MKKRYLAMVMAGLMMLLAAGCGGSSKSTADMSVTEEAVTEMAAEAPAEVMEESGAVQSGNGIQPVSETGRKLIKTVNLELQTKEFDSLIEGLVKKAEEMNGYIEGSSIWGSSYYYESTRSADYTIRVPSDRLDEFVDVVSGLGNVTYKNEDVQDVTLQYVDVESHKKALEIEQERLLELLEQAESLEDLLTIESRLSEVRYELENYGSQLRLLDNQIDYSTVHVTVTEVERITETKERTFFQEISDRFNDSLYVVGRGLRGFVVGFLGSLPILMVWAVVIGAVVLILRKAFGGKREKKERKPGRFHRSRKDETLEKPEE
ncbi:MAG: DUF4349 domain-containing protein [Clostridiales bacterium]|nr:DUF4349 domain-containing protein [Clostridiales bacterium]